MNMRIRIWLAFAAFLLLMLPLSATELVPDISVVFEEHIDGDTYNLPKGPFSDGHVPSVQVKGYIHRSVYQIKGGLTTTKLLDKFWNPLKQIGYESIFHCRDRECGGFEFRRAIDVVNAPKMFVNLGDFQFLSAVNKQDQNTQYISFLVSRSKSTGYVQIISTVDTIGNNAQIFTDIIDQATDTFTKRLIRDGHAVIAGLNFATGSSELEDTESSELAKLAAWLNNNPDTIVAIVGHTDNEGALDKNVRISTARANTILKLLVEVYRVNPTQVTALGIGYLSPITANETIEGRASNRRVEVVVMSHN